MHMCALTVGNSFMYSASDGTFDLFWHASGVFQARSSSSEKAVVLVSSASCGALGRVRVDGKE